MLQSSFVAHSSLFPNVRCISRTKKLNLAIFSLVLFLIFHILFDTLQGTTRPTHYHVLYDEVGYSADDLQELVHALSYV